MKKYTFFKQEGNNFIGTKAARVVFKNIETPKKGAEAEKIVEKPDVSKIIKEVMEMDSRIVANIKLLKNMKKEEKNKKINNFGTAREELLKKPLVKLMMKNDQVNKYDSATYIDDTLENIDLAVWLYFFKIEKKGSYMDILKSKFEASKPETVNDAKDLIRTVKDITDEVVQIIKTGKVPEEKKKEK